MCLQKAATPTLAMLFLIVQTSAATIVLRLSRIKAGPAYSAPVSVIYVELLKLIICTLAEAGYMAVNRKLSWSSIIEGALDIIATSIPMLLPACLFVVQQVLTIVAISHLDVVAFQILMHSVKVIPTALFARCLLGQRLTLLQWLSLPTLAIGTATVGLTSNDQWQIHRAVPYVGVMAGVLTGLCSAFSGVYFELYIKQPQERVTVKNIQLSLWGLPLGVLYALFHNGTSLQRHLQGFNWLVWLAIVLLAVGGIVVGIVIKYCDNVLKNFGQAGSVILTMIVAIPVFHQWPSQLFLFGVVLVVSSTLMYTSFNVQAPSCSDQ